MTASSRKNNKNKLTNPSVFSFTRKISTSDGLMFSGKWEDVGSNENWIPICLSEKTVRGTKSAYSTKENEFSESNIHTIDSAELLPNHDTLKLSFSVLFYGEISHPCASDRPDYTNEFKKKIDDYLEKSDALKELAKRYAQNLVNGRVLWRNEIGASKIKVIIKNSNNPHSVWEFNSSYYDKEFKKSVENSEHTYEIESFKNLIEAIFYALSGTKSLQLEIDCFSNLGKAQSIYPSQEFIFDEKNNNEEEGKKKKFLYSIKHNGIERHAGMHSQKIGNAIRTIDTWYTKPASKPIPVEPFGAVTHEGKAYRSTKNDFYSLLQNWIIDDKNIEDEDKLFVIACLIRGGLYQTNEKKNKPTDSQLDTSEEI